MITTIAYSHKSDNDRIDEVILLMATATPGYISLSARPRPQEIQEAILIAQHIEATTQIELPMTWSSNVTSEKQYNNNATPMEVDVENAQLQARRIQPTRDAQGRPILFCNNYGHVKKHCRKWSNQT